MSGITAGFVGLLFMAGGVATGWYAAHARISHGDMKSFKGRVPVARKNRNKHGQTTLILAAVFIFVLYAMLTSHK